jgi:hypothetical protein
MPKVPVDYSKCCIYKLVHKDDVNNENIYIGHTTNFRNRKYKHKSSCNNSNDKHYNEPMYNYLRNNGGWDEWVMIEIEKYPCEDIREAEKKERYWIEHYKSNLNKKIPGRTQQEYSIIRWQEIKDKPETKKYHQQWWNNNNGVKKTCECGCEVAQYKMKRHQLTAKHLKLMKNVEI